MPGENQQPSAGCKRHLWPERQPASGGIELIPIAQMRDSQVLSDRLGHSQIKQLFMFMWTPMSL